MARNDMSSTVVHLNQVTPSGDAASLPARLGVVRWAGLALVWCAIASGAIVFSEPAPVDVLTLGVILALPVLGLVSFRTLLIIPFGVWLVIGVATLLAAHQASDFARAVTHTSISFYLYAGFFMLAAFVAKNPLRHVPLIMGAYVVAALAAATAGIAGYFDLFAGAGDWFTKFGRASGTFKDPNVFGPFLIPPLLYVFHLVISRPASQVVLPAIVGLVLLFAVVISFSRGAWMNIAISLSLYACLAFATAPTWRQRMTLVLVVLLALLSCVLLLAAALRVPEFAELLHHRAQFFQSYDVGPEGRFGGQSKALEIILASPFGIGTMEFAERFHHENAHNVYLTMALRGGWLAGLLFLGLNLATVVIGFCHAIRHTPSRPIFIFVLAAFIGLAIQGMLVDTDHWRHFYVIMALVWGLMAAERPTADRQRSDMATPPHHAPRIHRRVKPNLPAPLALHRGHIVAPIALPPRPVLQDRTGLRETRPSRLIGIATRYLVSYEPAQRRLSLYRPRRPQFLAYT